MSRQPSDGRSEAEEWKRSGLLASHWLKEERLEPECWVLDIGVKPRSPCASTPPRVLAGSLLTIHESWITAITARVGHASLINEQVIKGLARSELPAEANWDGQGSAAYPDLVVERAAALVVAILEQAQAIDIPLEVPDIGPGPAGRVDLHWNAPTFQLLVAVPPEKGAAPTFYGDNRGDLSIKGQILGVDRFVRLVGGLLGDR